MRGRHLLTGYAFQLTQGDEHRFEPDYWRTAPNDEWEHVMLTERHLHGPPQRPRWKGTRFIDASKMNVWDRGNGIYFAQRV